MIRYVVTYTSVSAAECAAFEAGWRSGDGSPLSDWTDVDRHRIDVETDYTFPAALRTARSCLPLDLFGRVSVYREEKTPDDPAWTRTALWYVSAANPSPNKAAPAEVFDTTEPLPLN